MTTRIAIFSAALAIGAATVISGPASAAPDGAGTRCGSIQTPRGLNYIDIRTGPVTCKTAYDVTRQWLAEEQRLSARSVSVGNWSCGHHGAMEPTSCENTATGAKFVHSYS